MSPLPPGSALVCFLPSSDLDRSDAFFSGILGLARLESSSFSNLYESAEARLRVTLVPEPASAGYTVAGWEVGDIAGAMAALGKRGVEFRRYSSLEQDAAGIWTAPGGSRIAWFEDPDGNLLSLQQAP